MKIEIETDLETDGRWIAEALNIPGALAYGYSEVSAISAVLDVISRGRWPRRAWRDALGRTSTESNDVYERRLEEYLTREEDQ